MSNRPKALLRGFTLVELLVAIGVIAVLVSILIPSISRARESANRTICVSNLRQIAQLQQVYANQYGGFAPLGNWTNVKQNSYLIHYNNGGKAYYTGLGILFRTKIVTDPKSFFCPSEQSDWLKFSTEENVWPIEETVAGGDRSTRSSYVMRPVVSWPDGTPAKPGQILYPTSMPKLSLMAQKAILSDMVAGPEYLITRHKKGVNVAYADGSSRWVESSYFPNDWNTITGADESKLSPSNNAKMLDESVKPPVGVWTTLDK